MSKFFSFSYSWVFSLGLLLAALISLQACNEPAESSGGAEVDDEEAIDSSSVTAFRAFGTVSDTYTVLTSVDGDASTNCVAEEGEWIHCIVDMHELDLAFNGFELNVEAPNSLCKYVEFIPSFHAVAPIGRMPETVEYRLDAEGDLDGDISYDFDGVVRTHAQLYGAAATEPEDLRCPWDYRDVPAFVSGPNCCYGKYSVSVIDDGETTETDADWGPRSNYGNCFDGGAFRGGQPLNFLGLPAPVISNVPLTNLVNKFEVEGIIEIGEAFRDGEFLTLANHVDGADYIAGTGFPGHLVEGRSFPSYRYSCLDHAFEAVARIDVSVRSWATETEFAKFVGGDLTASPRSPGNEDDPFDDDELQDYLDWFLWNGNVNIGFPYTKFDLAIGAQDVMTYFDGNFQYIGFPYLRKR